MSANPDLVKARGISDEDVKLINAIHNEIENVINTAMKADDQFDRQYFFDWVKDREYELQALWGFSQDSMYHTWGERLHNRYRELDYVGAVYRCTLSGETYTLRAKDVTYNVVSIGECFIDFGSCVRIVGPLERIK